MRILTFILCLLSVNAFGEFDSSSDKTRNFLNKIKNDSEATEEVKTKAEDGDARSQLYLALIYFSGQGVAEDPVEGVKWLRKSALQDEAEAQYYLGSCYADGVKGLAKNDFEAFKWIMKSAEQGNLDAQAELGVLYKVGKGVTKDEVEAFKWFKKSAEQGNVMVQSDLAVCYIMGAGVPRDYVEGYAWLNLSCSGKFVMKRQREALNALERDMSPSQLEAGQKRSKQIQAEIDSRKASKEKKWWGFWR